MIEKARRGARWLVELSRWYGYRFGFLADREAYDDEFWTFHHPGDWPGFARVLLETFRPSVVVDVGCGDGKLLAAITAIAPHVSVAGFDGSPAALRRALAHGVPVTQVDLAARSVPPALTTALERCDLALCLETAEHLPPWYARGLVAALARAPRVVFSGAQPGQGGRLHVNEQPPQYWVDLFAAEGLTPHASEDAVRARLGALHLPSWYVANLQVFDRP